MKFVRVNRRNYIESIKFSILNVAGTKEIKLTDDIGDLSLSIIYTEKEEETALNIKNRILNSGLNIVDNIPNKRHEKGWIRNRSTAFCRERDVEITFARFREDKAFGEIYKEFDKLLNKTKLK